MDASGYAAVAALSFSLGVIFACGLGLGMATAVRLSRRIERAERRYKSVTQIPGDRIPSHPAQAPPRPRDRTPEPPHPGEYAYEPPSPMVRPREPYTQTTVMPEAPRA